MERKKTRFQGVYTSESASRRHNGKPDVMYIVDYYDATGKRVRKTVGRASEKMTAALAYQIRLRLLNAVHVAQTALPPEAADLAPKPTPMTLGEAFERYRTDWLEAKGKASANEASLMRTHLAPLAVLPLEGITTLRLDQLMREMAAKGKSPQYIRLAVTLVRRVMRRMEAWGLYAGPDPFRRLTLPSPNNARERYLTPAEATALLAELKRRSSETWLMALISLHCGLRFGEVAALTYADANFTDGTLYVRESKSGRARHAVMTDDVGTALRALDAAHRGAKGELLFPAKGGGVRKACPDTFVRAVDALGLNNTGRSITLPDGRMVPEKITDRRRKVVFHTLRHTYASWLARAGEHEISLAELLGHTSTAMTKRYSHLMDDARRETARKISAIFHTTHGNTP